MLGRRGLQFGLWIAWSQGGHTPDASGKQAFLSVRDPAMKSWFPEDYAADWKNSDFTGATVCLAEPKAVTWAARDMLRAVKEYKLDLLEHDQYQIVERCNRSDHRHTSSPIDVAYHAARGYYEVQDAIRAAFPDLIFENCCNGGQLVDYGISRRTHYISITDTYDPLSNRRAFFDSSYALPPAMCECLHRESAWQDDGQFQVHAPQRHDGVVYDHGRHDAVVARATGRGDEGSRHVQEVSSGRSFSTPTSITFRSGPTGSAGMRCSTMIRAPVEAWSMYSAVPRTRRVMPSSSKASIRMHATN